MADLVRACGSVGLRGKERASCVGGPEDWQTGEPEDRRTGRPENWRTGGPENRRVRARALQRNAPELPRRPSSARRR